MCTPIRCPFLSELIRSECYDATEWFTTHVGDMQMFEFYPLEYGHGVLTLGSLCLLTICVSQN